MFILGAKVMVMDYLINLLWAGLLALGILVFCWCKNDYFGKLSSFFTISNMLSTFLIWLIVSYYRQSRILLINVFYIYIICVLNILLGLLFLLRQHQDKDKR